MAKRKNPLYVGTDRVTKIDAIVEDNSPGAKKGAKKFSDEFDKLVYSSPQNIAVSLNEIIRALVSNQLASFDEIETIKKTHPDGDKWNPENDALMAFLGYLQNDFLGTGIAKAINTADTPKNLIKALTRAHKGLLNLKITDGVAKAKQAETLQDSIASAEETKKASDIKRLAEISNAYIALNFRYASKPPTDEELKELKRKVEAHNKQVATFRKDPNSKDAFVDIELDRLKSQLTTKLIPVQTISKDLDTLVKEYEKLEETEKKRELTESEKARQAEIREQMRSLRKGSYLSEKAEKDWERVNDNYSIFRYYVEPDSLKMTLLKMLLGYSVPVYGRDSSGRLDFKKTQYFTYAGQNRNQFNVVQPGFTSGPKKNLFDTYRDLKIQKPFPQWIKDNYIKELRDFVPNISVAREISFDARATEGTLDKLELATLQGTFGETFESILQQQDIQSGRVDYEQSLARLEQLVETILPEVFENILRYQSMITFDENIGCFYPTDFADLYEAELAKFDLNVVLPKYSEAKGKPIDSIDTEDPEVIDEIWDWHLLDKYEYLKKMSSSDSDISLFFVRRPSDLGYDSERLRQLFGQSMGGDFTPDYTYWNAFKKVTKEDIEEARVRLRVSYLNYKKYLLSIEKEIEFRAIEKEFQSSNRLLQNYLQTILNYRRDQIKYRIDYLQGQLTEFQNAQNNAPTDEEKNKYGLKISKIENTLLELQNFGIFKSSEGQIRPFEGMDSDLAIASFSVPFKMKDLANLGAYVVRRQGKRDWDPTLRTLLRKQKELLSVFSDYFERKAYNDNISWQDYESYIGNQEVTVDLYVDKIGIDYKSGILKFKLGTAARFIKVAQSSGLITAEEKTKIEDLLEATIEANSNLENIQKEIGTLAIDITLDYKKFYLDAVGKYHDIMERVMRQQGLKQKDASIPAYPKVSQRVGVQLGGNLNEYCIGHVVEVDYRRKVAKILPENYKESAPYVSKVLLAPFFSVFSNLEVYIDKDLKQQKRPSPNTEFLKNLTLVPPNDAYSIFNVCLAKDVPINVGDYREFHVKQGNKHVTRAVEIMVIGPLGRRDAQSQVVPEDVHIALKDEDILVAIVEDSYKFGYTQLYKVKASAIGPLILTKEQALQWPNLYNSPQEYDDEFLTLTKMQASEVIPKALVRHNPHRSVSSNFAIWTLWGSCLNIMLTDILQSREFKDIASLIESFSTNKDDILRPLLQIQKNTKEALKDMSLDDSLREKLESELSIIEENIKKVQASSSPLEILTFLEKDQAQTLVDPIAEVVGKNWHELTVDDLVLYLIYKLRRYCYKPYDTYMHRNFMDKESKDNRKAWRSEQDTLIIGIAEANKKLQEYQSDIEKLEQILKTSSKDTDIITQKLRKLESLKKQLSEKIVKQQQDLDTHKKRGIPFGRSTVPFSHEDMYKNLFAQWQKNFMTQNYSGLTYYWSLRTNWISSEKIEQRKTKLGTEEIPTYTNRFAEVSSRYTIPQIFFRNNETSKKDSQAIITQDSQVQSYQYYLLDNFKNSEKGNEGKGFYILKNQGKKDYVFERKLEPNELNYIKPYFYVPHDVYKSLQLQVNANQRKLLEERQRQSPSLTDTKSGVIVPQTQDSSVVLGSDSQTIPGSQKISGTRQRKKARNNPRNVRSFESFGDFYTKCVDPFKLIVEYIIVSDYMRLKRRRSK